MADDASKIVFEVVQEFWWPVVVTLPADGGATEERRFEVRMRLLPDDELLAAEGADPIVNERAALARAITGWRDQDKQQAALLPAFSAEALQAVLAWGAYRRGIARAVWDAHTGGRAGETARAKN